LTLLPGYQQPSVETRKTKKERNSRFDNLVETNTGKDDVAGQRQIDEAGE